MSLWHIEAALADAGGQIPGWLQVAGLVGVSVPGDVVAQQVSCG